MVSSRSTPTTRLEIKLRDVAFRLRCVEMCPYSSISMIMSTHVEGLIGVKPGLRRCRMTEEDQEVAENTYIMASGSYSAARISLKLEPSTGQDGCQRSFSRSRLDYSRSRQCCLRREHAREPFGS